MTNLHFVTSRKSLQTQEDATRQLTKIENSKKKLNTDDDPTLNESRTNETAAIETNSETWIYGDLTKN